MGKASPEPRSFALSGGTDVELEPIKNPNRATAPIVARGVNRLHSCVERGFSEIKEELEIIRTALHIDEKGRRVRGSPIWTMTTWQAGWRGAVAMFAGISATLVVWRGLFEMWPALLQFGGHFIHWINTGHP